MNWSSFMLGLCVGVSAQVFGGETEMRDALSRWDLQVRDWTTAYEHASSNAEKEKLVESRPNGQSVGRELFKAVPMSEFEKPWALPAVVWWLNNPDILTAVVPESRQKDMAEAVLASVEKVHFNAPGVAGACAALGRGVSFRVYKVLESIFLSNENATAKGSAALAMAMMLHHTPSIEQQKYVGGNDKKVMSYRLFYVREALLRCPESPFGLSTVQEVAIDEVYCLTKLVEGRMPPAVEVKAEDGTMVKFPSTEKPTLILFWSPNDETSLSVMAMLDEFRASHPELAVCPVLSGVKLAELPDVMKNCGLKAMTYVDEEGKAAQDYRLQTMPYAYLIGKDGKTVYCGYPDMALQAKLRDSLKKMASSTDASAGQKNAPPATSGAPAPAALTPEELTPALRSMPDFK